MRECVPPCPRQKDTGRKSHLAEFNFSGEIGTVFYGFETQFP